MLPGVASVSCTRTFVILRFAVFSVVVAMVLSSAGVVGVVVFCGCMANAARRLTSFISTLPVSVL